MDALKQKIRTYIEQNFLYMRADLELRDEDSLLGKGIVDSMGVMEIISFLEEELGVVVADEDITEENLGTVTAIARYASDRGAVVQPQQVA